jgi:hypothetical protein
MVVNTGFVADNTNIPVVDNSNTTGISITGVTVVTPVNSAVPPTEGCVPDTNVVIIT